jgi:hypothetical protein
LLPANVSVSPGCRRSRFFGFLYEGSSFSVGRVSAPHCLRFLSTLARETLQRATKSFQRHSSLVFDGSGGRLDSVSAGHREPRGECFGEIRRESSVKRKGIIAASLGIAIVLFLCFYFFWGSSVPNGQQPLVRLDNSNFASLKEAFNASANDVRVMVMLSPT